MARQLHERFPVKAYFGDLATLLREARPDVVHHDPPASHFDIARVCLERGCHVFIEKPVTLNANDAEGLVALANEARGTQADGRTRRSVQPRRSADADARRDRLSGRRSRAHGELLLLRPGRPRVCASASRRAGSLGAQAARGSSRTSSATGLPGSPSSCRAMRPVIAYGFVTRSSRAWGSEILDELRVIVSDDERTTAYHLLLADAAAASTSSGSSGRWSGCRSRPGDAHRVRGSDSRAAEVRPVAGICRSASGQCARTGDPS